MDQMDAMDEDGQQMDMGDAVAHDEDDYGEE